MTIKALRTFRVHPSLPAELEPLHELAMNLRWAWDQPTVDLFRWADAEGWDEVHQNPVALLGRLSPVRLAALTDDAAFLAALGEAQESLQRYMQRPRWAQAQAKRPPRIAYFSMEFGLTHTMQIYSGGLGVLAGDHLKAASDLGLDLVGVGLLYRHGYFRQFLDADGWQQEHYPDLNPFSLPLQRLEREGSPALVEVRVGDHAVVCQVWKAQVGRIPLLLLDTDLAQNAPEDRAITDKLYGGDIEHRLRQEIVFGVGGVRALDLACELGEVPESWVPAGPEIYHCNEGHAGYLQFERIRRLVAEEGLEFHEAIESARARAVFTTHTPVPAGIDVFPGHLMQRYFTEFAADCKTTLADLMGLGQSTPEGIDGTFNMAIMALRLSAKANGVSQLHGEVSRQMFAHLWPGIPHHEVPIGSVTNGVHAATWVGPEMTAVYDRHLDPDWAHNPAAWKRVSEIGDDALWRARGRARERMVQRVRAAVRAGRERRGESTTTLGWTEEIFDPEALTIGFARRFAEYKRGTLLLRQPERLRSMLLSTDRPVQIVFAGKAHPRDELGKDLIRQIVHFSDDPHLRTKLVVVEDYDMELASVLLQGVDVWLNNPRRPHEACGTSGEKAVLNGALHCSTLDGWWDEMFDGENGFAIGAAADNPDIGQQDAADASSLFEVLERTVIPMFYERPQGPLPRRWLGRVHRSLETLAPRVLATRMVREYVEEHYRPVARRADRLTAKDYRPSKQLASWRSRIRDAWESVSVRSVTGDEGVAALGEQRNVRAVIALGTLQREDVSVELLHGPVRADGMLSRSETLELDPEGPEGEGAFAFKGEFVCLDSGEYGFAVRVVPANADLLSWQDTGLVTWADESASIPDGEG